MANEIVIRVMVIDNQSMVRIGLAGMIETLSGMELVGTALSLDEAVHNIPARMPDVILMESSLLKVNGIEAPYSIRQAYPAARVLVLSNQHNAADIYRAMSAGAVGFLMKNVTSRELEQAILSAAVGQVTLSPEAAKVLVSYGQALKASARDLTGRELQILALIVRGLSNGQIASMLTVSPFTVKAHVSSILSKLGAATRAEAAAYAVRYELVSFDERQG